MQQTEGYAPNSPVLALTVEEFKNLVAQAARGDETVDAVLGDRWNGGELVLRPGKPGLQEKVIPLDEFFRKIVMVRDRLRVLEQKLNSHATLTPAEKIDFQQYVTRCYGSLTTFNLLFKYRDDQFRGTGNLV
jgi:hypothetical protein